MAVTIHDHIMRVANRFFHDRGLEPSINMESGEIVFFMPEGWTEEEFNQIMADLEDHISQAAESIGC